jgi:hypothetical protein
VCQVKNLLTLQNIVERIVLILAEQLIPVVDLKDNYLHIHICKNVLIK